MGLIIWQLRDHAAYGNATVSLLSVVLQAGRILAQSAGFCCELSTVSLNGALMKNGDHFKTYCSFLILLLGTKFIKKCFCEAD